MREHCLIEGVLKALEDYVAAVERGAGFERADLGRFVTFIREFADARHHAKEEDVLFDAMVASGFARDRGPIAVMLGEHDLGRNHAARLAEIAGQNGVWSDELVAVLARAARAYAGLLRGHIAREDHVLYPMARSVLSPETLQRVTRRCEELDQRQTGTGDAAALERLGTELAERYAG